MTRLFVLRHAKAAAALPGMRDFDRPLERVGLSAAGLLGEKLLNSGHVPDEILCSPSVRTRQTLEGVSQHFSVKPKVTFEEDLYSGEWTEYLEFIRAHVGNGSLMIVGHNPACEDIVHQLVGTGEKRAIRTLLDGFAPGTLAIIDFKEPYSEIGPKKGHLESLLIDGCAKRTSP